MSELTLKSLLQGRLPENGAGMGIATNPRGQLRQAQRVDAEILRMVAGDLTPDTLTPAELELDRYPVTRPARAEPVWAWVHYGSRAVRVEAELVGWTDKAGACRWEVPKRGVQRAWLWLPAIEPRSPVGGKALRPQTEGQPG